MAETFLPEARQLPSIPVEHGHKRMEFHEPENREGEALIRPRVGGKTGSAQHCPPYYNTVPSSSHQYGHFSQAPAPDYLYAQSQQPPSPAWSYYEQNQMPQTLPTSLGFCYSPSAPVLSSFRQGQFPPLPSPLAQLYTPPLHASAPAAAAASPSDPLSENMNRYRRWRHNGAELEDQKGLAKGELHKKRQWKQDYHYQCSVCGQAKKKSTGHTQTKGKRYCPASGQTILEWKECLAKQ